MIENSPSLSLAELFEKLQIIESTSCIIIPYEKNRNKQVSTVNLLLSPCSPCLIKP